MKCVFTFVFTFGPIAPAPLSPLGVNLMFSVASALRSTWPQPQLRPWHHLRHQTTPVRSALITPEPGIRSDLFTRPTAATSSLQSPVSRPQWWSPLGDEPAVPTVHSQRNKCFIFVSLSGVCERMEQRVSVVKQRVRTKANYQMSQKEIRNPCHFVCISLQPSPSL